MVTPTPAERASVAALLLAFTATSLFWSPHTWGVAVPGLVTSAIAWFGARRFGPAQNDGKEIIAVFLLAALAIALPVDPPIGLSTWTAILLGILTTEAAWAVWRFPHSGPVSPLPLRTALAGSLKFGMWLACGYTVIAAALILVGGLSGRLGTALWPFLLLLTGGYVLGGFLGGMIVALLRRATGSALGTMAVGAMVGVCVYGAVAPSIALFGSADGRSAETLPAQAAIAIACGLLVGPPASLVFRSVFLAPAA